MLIESSKAADMTTNTSVIHKVGYIKTHTCMYLNGIYLLRLNFVNVEENGFGPINCPTGYPADVIS